MPKDTPQTRTLKRALGVAGSTKRLADLLGADISDLSAWLAGDRSTPTDMYMRALDVVSQGHFYKASSKGFRRNPDGS
jgi:DNA-binding transcriptional regulator YdaS (Cro superfamily)